jgi:hypothetical protein
MNPIADKHTIKQRQDEDNNTKSKRYSAHTHLLVPSVVEEPVGPCLFNSETVETLAAAGNATPSRAISPARDKPGTITLRLIVVLCFFE